MNEDKLHSSAIAACFFVVVVVQSFFAMLFGDVEA